MYCLGLVLVDMFMLVVITSGDEDSKVTSSLQERTGVVINSSPTGRYKLRGEDKFVDDKLWSEVVENYVDERRSKYEETFNGDIRFVEASRDCGRMKNRLLRTDQGGMYCARYRDNIEQLQGEFYSYVISVMLGIENVPPVHILQVEPSSKMWSAVWPDLEVALWRPHAVVALTQWVDNLLPTKGPNYLRKDDCRIDERYMNENEVSLDDASYLMQWSDMVLFDFITGNVDRFISHLHNSQWDRNAMQRPIHNLLQDENGTLVFLDNESGLGHSYHLLTRYQHLHVVALNGVCVFRKSTANKIQKLNKYTIEDFEDEMGRFVNANNGRLIPILPKKNIHTLTKRVEQAAQHIHEHCQIVK